MVVPSHQLIKHVSAQTTWAVKTNKLYINFCHIQMINNSNQVSFKRITTQTQSKERKFSYIISSKNILTKKYRAPKALNRPFRRLKVKERNRTISSLKIPYLNYLLKNATTSPIMNSNIGTDVNCLRDKWLTRVRLIRSSISSRITK